MDAPKGRYSVVEKGGRLIVIDNSTGAPATPVMPNFQPDRPGAPASLSQPGVPASSSSFRPRAGAEPIVAGKGMADGIADYLLTLAVKEWDADGRARVGWEWKENGKTKRWDAWLDAAQQRRLGRALLRLAAAPLFVLWLIFFSGWAMWIALGLTAFPVVAGFAALNRLQRETGGIADSSGQA